MGKGTRSRANRATHSRERPRKATHDIDVRERLVGIFDANEELLQIALTHARAAFNHSGVKGDAVERAVRDFLRAHLPRAFDIGTGEVVDIQGHRSPQLDVVVSNSDQPFVHPQDTPGIYLAEGVSAVGEVKSVLNSGALDDILRKGKLIRTLVPAHAAGDVVNGNPVDIARFVNTIPYFALAIESDISTDGILQRLSAEPELSVAQHAAPIMLPAVDLLVVLRPKLSLIFITPGGVIHLVDAAGNDVAGWGQIGGARPLTELFVWLNANATRVKRFASIATPYLTPTSRAELDAIRAREAVVGAVIPEK